MKKLTLFIFALLLATATFAQKSGYSQGDNLLNVGIGLNSYYSSGIPFGASYEYGFTETISAGLNIDYLSTKYDGLGSWKFTALYIGARGSYHFNELLNLHDNKVDLYGGATLGYRSFSWSDTVLGSFDDTYGSGLYLGLFIGGKYYFTDQIGAFAELGAIGSTNVRIGVAFRF